jgi:predicted transposase/invertase (TIGR01784 family)
MASPHDALFKYVFRQPEHAASELRAIFPSALSERLDWRSLHLQPSSFVDEELRGRHADLLFSVRCEGLPAYVYVLFEHQSTNDPLMAFRLLRYLVRIWDSVLSKHPESRRLPAIVPVVLYQGKSEWAAATELRELIDLDPLTLVQVGSYVPQFRFILDDLTRVDDEELRSRSLTAQAAAALALLARVRGRATSLPALRRWVDVFYQVQRGTNGREALVAFWEYALRVGDMDPKDLSKLAQEIGPMASEAYVTAAEILCSHAKAEGIALGKAEGKAEGRIEGNVEGRAELVLRQLQLKFGVNPAAFRQRVLAASPHELDMWADRIITASSLEEAMDTERGGVTAAEVLRARGFTEGRLQILEEAKTKGKAELVLRQLELKFGVMPESVRQRVLLASSGELDVWGDFIITASRVEDLPRPIGE